MLNKVDERFGGLAAVDNLSLRVDRGDIFGLLGPNGAGKTTTVKILTGLLRPSAGSVRIAGIDVAQQPLEAKRRMGLVPDEPFVYPKLTVVEFLHFVGELYGVPLDVQKRRIPELLEKAGVERSSVKGIGIGFGGPVDDATHTVIKSHQIEGWDNFALADWLAESLITSMMLNVTTSLYYWGTLGLVLAMQRLEQSAEAQQTVLFRRADRTINLQPVMPKAGASPLPAILKADNSHMRS